MLGAGTSEDAGVTICRDLDDTIKSCFALSDFQGFVDTS